MIYIYCYLTTFRHIVKNCFSSFVHFYETEISNIVQHISLHLHFFIVFCCNVQYNKKKPQYIHYQELIP